MLIIVYLKPCLHYIRQPFKEQETITYYYNRNQNKKDCTEGSSLWFICTGACRTYQCSCNELLQSKSDYYWHLIAGICWQQPMQQLVIKIHLLPLLPASFSGEESVPQTGGSYYSDIRDEAIALNALMDVDPGNAQIGIMAKHVSR